jgi:hypothetical protein
VYISAAQNWFNTADDRFRFAVRPSAKMSPGDEVVEITTPTRGGIVLQVDKDIARVLRCDVDYKALAAQLSPARKKLLPFSVALAQGKESLKRYLRSLPKKKQYEDFLCQLGDNVFSQNVHDLLHHPSTACPPGASLPFVPVQSSAECNSNSNSKRKRKRKRPPPYFLVGRTFPLPPPGEGMRWYFRSQVAATTRISIAAKKTAGSMQTRPSPHKKQKRRSSP